MLPRIDGSLFGNENGRKRWTDEDDRFLLYWGWSIGVDYIAGHDLRRSRAAAYKRLAWLRANKPDLYERLWRGPKAAADAGLDDEPPALTGG